MNFLSEKEKKNKTKNNDTAKSRYPRLLEDSVMIINVPGGTSLVSGVKVKVKSFSHV